MMRGLFVTGTDTGVGKTTVSAALLCRLTAPPFRYWKPIQTGIEQDNDTETVMRLSGISPDRLLDEGIRLPRPLSPHLAARLNGTAIALTDILSIASRQPSSDRWIVEGAGGVLVPISDRANMTDVMLGLGLPALIVARSGLGTINHTVLTIEALRTRSVPVAGVVMVGPPDADNRAAIERFGKVKVIGELPWLESVTPEGIHEHAGRFDPDYVLGMSDSA